MPFVETNGIRMHYVEGGRGPALMWVPGRAEHAAMALRAHAPLLDRCRFIAVDPRGQGGTTAFVAAASYAPSLLAADLHGLRDALGLERPIVGGHGRGARSVLEYARAHPAQVTAVIAVAPPVLEGHPEQQRFYLKAAARLRADGIEPFLGRLPGAPRDPVRRAEWEAHLRQLGAEAVAAEYEALAGLRPIIDDTSTLTMPILVVCGAQDRLIEDAQALAAAVPSARLAVISNAGHAPALENPGPYFAALDAFLVEVT